ncbi:MAG TPA: copper amine oxidase N-terminal domain-containing protein [Candidatus Dormibacteraeota bacterium]|nr:copper amine oxidase N-terminal domain-containing protein [Candidatus Dormibacteraeota bacterium]
MKSKIVRFLGVATAAALLAQPAIALANPVTVVVNGSQMQFDQPPIEQAGRVFVPLRGVFERLGATVVYSNGLINATGNGRSISLHIGSTQATVNGQTQYLDVAPFEVGARTLVPLRFVAQALGAAVSWDQASSTVTINGSGNGSGGAAPAQNNLSFALTAKRPTGNVQTAYPAIHAAFSEPVNRNTLRVAIDGRDVTANVYANPNGFDVTPPFALSSGTHHVRVTGTTQAGASFATGWAFNSGAATSQNYIRALQPQAGGVVPSSFALTGRTLPGSQVHIVATGQASAMGGLLQVGTGTFQTDTTADGNGVFRANISINAVNGGSVRVLIQSTAPGGASIERSFNYST